jgi:hypothetical protein
MFRLFKMIRFWFGMLADWVLDKFTDYDRLPYPVENEEELYNAHLDPFGRPLNLDDFIPVIPIAVSDEVHDTRYVETEEGVYVVDVSCQAVVYRKAHFPWREVRMKFRFVPNLFRTYEGEVKEIDHIPLGEEDKLYQFNTHENIKYYDDAIEHFKTHIIAGRTGILDKIE